MQYKLCVPSFANSAWEAAVEQSEELACLDTTSKKLVKLVIKNLEESNMNYQYF